MSHYIVIIGGLSPELYDLVRAESSKKFAPTGTLIIRPTHGGLTLNHADELLAAARVYAKSLREDTTLNILTITVTDYNQSDAEFRTKFFPFSLYIPIPAPQVPPGISKARRNQILNAFIDNIIRVTIDGRRRSNIIRDRVSVTNLSPLLLPIRNFKSKALTPFFAALYNQLSGVDDVGATINEAVRDFIQRHPYRKPPTSDLRCLSDGDMYFKSPGKHRHGYYRNSNDNNHKLTCLLNARSRLGGGYPHNFHFDCEPVKRLDAAFPNCHGADEEPKPTHVNIGPSDAII